VADHVLAEIKDYSDLLGAMRARAQQRQIAVGGEDVAAVTGLPRGYMQKLLGPRPQRRIGLISLGPTLAILGLKLLAVEDAEAIERYGARLHRRNESLVRAGSVDFKLSRRHMRKIQRAGGKARWAKLSPDQRSELGRELNRARWKQSGRNHERP